MKNKRFYTDKDFEGKLPEPGTPVDEAWKQMHELLIKNNLATPQKKNKRITIFLVLLLLFISITGVTLYSLYFHGKGVKIAANDSSIKKTQRQNNAGKNFPADTTHQHLQPGNANKVSRGDKETGVSTEISPNNNFPMPVTDDQALINKTISEENKLNPVHEEINYDPQRERKEDNRTDIKNEAQPTLQTSQSKKEDSVQQITSGSDSTQQLFSKSKPGKNSNQVKFHYGLQWNINFSLKNNSNYFDSYNGGKQYYMWTLPAAWAKMDINKKHGIILRFNPFSQQFAGKQVVHVEKPFIASIEPDSVTSLIKSRGYNFGLNYEYNINSTITFTAGLSYTVQHNALYLKQAVEGYSGNVLSESIFAAKKKDDSFKYLNASYLSWNGSVKYNFRKLSIGAGITRPITNLSSNSEYNVRPLNGEFYLQYYFK